MNLSEPLEDLVWINEEINNHKKKLKNKRKPTDILIYTDGYSFSAASTFIKYIQYYGGGIVVGFFGNLNVIIFHLIVDNLLLLYLKMKLYIFKVQMLINI